MRAYQKYIKNLKDRNEHLHRLYTKYCHKYYDEYFKNSKITKANRHLQQENDEMLKQIEQLQIKLNNAIQKIKYQDEIIARYEDCPF